MESEWLREGIRFALRASIYTTDIGDAQPPERDPRLRKLIEKVLFSRRFILTYHLVILGFVVVLSTAHWTAKTIRWRRKRLSRLQIVKNEDKYDGDAETIKPVPIASLTENVKLVHSSGSSTIDGTESPPRKDIDENEATPLLKSSIHHFPQGSLISTVRALLIHQPRPIPVIDKLLPSNGTSVVVLAFLGLNFFYIFYDIRINVIDFVVLADRLGLVFSANIPLLYLLAAKNQPLKFLTGRSYESLNIFHRRLGELLCLEGFFHSAGFLIVWYVLFKPSGFGLVRFLLLRRNLIGVGMLLAYELLYFTSLGSFRQRWYELFLGFHVVFQVFALVGLYFHHHTGRPYAAAALVIFVVDRLVHRLSMKSMTVDAQTKILEDEETIKISSAIILRPRSGFLSVFGKSISRGWQAADHIFVTVPSLSRKHILQAHPFTIASAAPRPGDEVARMDLIIRAQDGFSRNLLNAARLHKSLKMRIDGPYGSSHAREMLEDSDLALVIAGGSGIAVSWPLLRHLLNMNRSPDTEIATTFSLHRKKIILIWVIHETAHLSWLGREALAEAELMGAEIIIPRATEEIGRPDLKEMIRGFVDLHASEGGKRTSVVASGPDGMGRLVRNTCADLVRKGRDVRVAIEKFGW
ncbi:ferric reductase-like protein transmembrane component [Rhexocercosporidium sp. MPI-PUGE-AT-0058]|nr:ferric reductase-like protein transmembrane component [Rhexocercosporidium sp. MPI-PUGE-AT-0058]